MSEQRLSTRPLVEATLVGTVLQLAMVVTGHSNKTVAGLFAVMGMTISLLVGLMYALRARPDRKGSAALGGAVAGGVCALLGNAAFCFSSSSIRGSGRASSTRSSGGSLRSSAGNNASPTNFSQSLMTYQKKEQP